jgi:hypothetical protein
MSRKTTLAGAAGLVAGLAFGAQSWAAAGHTNSVLTAALDGRDEVANGATDNRIVGDPNGSGEVYVFGVDPQTSPTRTTLCYVLIVDGILDGAPGAGSPFMAHIHRGAAGSNGPVVANLAFPQGGQSADCLDQDEPGKFVNGGSVEGILANPDDYYVNVHNAEYPSGAIRGQLEVQDHH